MSTNPMMATLFAAAIICAAAPAFADTIGQTGQVVGILLNEEGSDEFGGWYGKITVRQADLTLRSYIWGGSLCLKNKPLSTAKTEILSRAVGNRSVEIKPFYKTGSGAARCLVSFVLAEPDVVDGIGQTPF